MSWGYTASRSTTPAHLIYEGDHRPQALDLDRSAFGYGSDPQRSLGASAREHAYWCAPAARGLRGLTGGELF